MKVLGIETSCDETAASVVEDGSRTLSNVVSSQAAVHAQFGGVVPEVASRRHVEAIVPVVDSALKEAALPAEDIDLIAVTTGPGLVGSLVVGVAFAKGMSLAARVPIVGVHHIQAHLYANFLSDCPPRFPFVGLVVSGGHSDLIWAEDHAEQMVLGSTRDDAAGEAFDKGARALGLGFPGGPEIEQAAKGGSDRAVDLPIAATAETEFSFSGVKSALVRTVRDGRDALRVADLAASYQRAIVEPLVQKTLAAAHRLKPRAIVVGGGVSANRLLRERLTSEAGAAGLSVFFPDPALSTDNAAMVASRGFYQFHTLGADDLTLDAAANLPWPCSGGWRLEARGWSPEARS
jgi:N6-L-threonylcarbamoyladenine synthase